MILRYEHPTREQLFSIDLYTRNEIIKGKLIGTKCESVMALSVKTSDNGRESLAYVWTLGIASPNRVCHIITGRDLRELDFVLKDLAVSSAFQSLKQSKIKSKDDIEFITEEKRLNHYMNIYIHDMSKEFQLLRNLYNKKFAYLKKGDRPVTFSRMSRNVMTTQITCLIGNCHVKLIDSMALTKKSLKDWNDDENMGLEFEVVEDGGIKTPETMLTAKEMEQFEKEILIILQGMSNYKARFKTLNNIPITQTGIVRRIIRENVCMPKTFEDMARGATEWGSNCAFYDSHMTPEDYARYRQIFSGGSVILNQQKLGRLHKNISAYDFSSAYIAIMTHMKFPDGNFEEVKKAYDRKILESFDNLLDINREHFWYAHYEFTDVCINDGGLPFWPANKCMVEESEIEERQNGKITKATKLNVFMTDIDFWIFSRVYNWKEKKTLNMWKSKAVLLPETFIKLLLGFYAIKEQYKNIEEKKSLYNEAKAMASSSYGAAVTRMFDDDIIFTEDGWETKPLDLEMFMKKKERITPKNHFLCYSSAVWIPAWCRYWLWQFALQCEERVHYGDTDSLIGEFNARDRDRFQKWELFLIERRKEISKIYQSITPELYCPKRPNGELASLGSFQFEHMYDEFKCIGLKRYVGTYTEHGKTKMKTAIAGLPKSAVSEKIQKPKDLNGSLSWNSKESKLIVPTFNDEQESTVWTDRDGNTYKSNQKYGVAFVPTAFTLTEYGNMKSVVELMTSDTYSNHGMPDATDPLFIRQQLEKK